MAVRKLKPIEERDPYAALVLATYDRLFPVIRDCSTCIGPTPGRDICNPCDNDYCAWQPIPPAEDM